MNRRDLIKTAIGFPLVSGMVLNGSALASSRKATGSRSRVRPGDPMWPCA
jgi:hypothetical protein